MAVLSRRGFDAARGSTALRGIFSKLIKPTEQGKKELEKYGLTFEAIRKQVEDEGLLSALETISRTFEGDSEGLGKVFEDVEGLAGILAIFSGDIADVRDILDSTANSAGDLDAALKPVQDTLSFRWDQALAGGMQVLVDLGERNKDFFNKLFDIGEELLDLYFSLSDGQKAFVARVLASGPALLGLGVGIKGVSIALGPFAALLKLATGRQVAANAAAAAGATANKTLAASLLGPVGVVAALVAGAAAFARFWESSQDKRVSKLGQFAETLPGDDSRRARIQQIASETASLQEGIVAAQRTLDIDERDRLIRQRQALLKEGERLRSAGSIGDQAQRITTLEDELGNLPGEQRGRRGTLSRLRDQLAETAGIGADDVDAEIARVLSESGHMGPIDRSAEGRATASTFAAGITDGEAEIEAAVEAAMRGVAEYLPQSDAMRGPLSRLTESGRAILGHARRRRPGGA